jgi:hypothetical protein
LWQARAGAFTLFCLRFAAWFARCARRLLMRILCLPLVGASGKLRLCRKTGGLVVGVGADTSLAVRLPALFALQRYCTRLPCSAYAVCSSLLIYIAVLRFLPAITGAHHFACRCHACPANSMLCRTVVRCPGARLLPCHTRCRHALPCALVSLNARYITAALWFVRGDGRASSMATGRRQPLFFHCAPPRHRACARYRLPLQSTAAPLPRGNAAAQQRRAAGRTRTRAAAAGTAAHLPLPRWRP